jgi:hypothetical protein
MGYIQDMLRKSWLPCLVHGFAWWGHSTQFVAWDMFALLKGTPVFHTLKMQLKETKI